MVKLIDKENISANRLLELGFSRPMYAGHLDLFIEEVNKGAQADKALMIGYLIKQACKYCGISTGYRTAFYDLAWAVLQESPELWNEEENEEGISDLSAHYDLYPDYKNEFDEYDVASLNNGEYFVICMDLMRNERQEHPDYFCYAMFVFFEQGNMPYDDEMMEEALEAIEEAEENEH
jgi:hypothetical protein